MKAPVSRKTLRRLHLLAAAAIGLVVAACNAPPTPAGPPGSHVVVPTGQIEIPRVEPARAEPPAAPFGRPLTFVVVGRGLAPAEASPREAELAGVEAAIVQGLYRIVRQRPHDFEFISGIVDSSELVVVLGANLTLRCRQDAGQPRELVLRLDDRGRVTRLRVVGSRLTHPPHSLRVLLELLARTNGAVKLLATGRGDQRGQYYASLGYYGLTRVPSATTRASSAETTPLGRRHARLSGARAAPEQGAPGQ